MGLSYHFTFTATAEAKPGDLVKFLNSIERQAKKLGFQPTMVLDAPFDTPERRQFARRLTTGFPVQDDRLKGLVMPMAGSVWHHGPEDGVARAVPEHGIVLIVTNERSQESVFGFLRYPDEIKDVNGRIIASTGLHGRWFLRNFIDSPDPRYRQIVQRFKRAGYVESEDDEFG